MLCRCRSCAFRLWLLLMYNTSRCTDKQQQRQGVFSRSYLEGRPKSCVFLAGRLLLSAVLLIESARACMHVRCHLICGRRLRHEVGGGEDGSSRFALWVHGDCGCTRGLFDWAGLGAVVGRRSSFSFERPRYVLVLSFVREVYSSL